MPKQVKTTNHTSCPKCGNTNLLCFPDNFYAKKICTDCDIEIEWRLDLANRQKPLIQHQR